MCILQLHNYFREEVNLLPFVLCPFLAKFAEKDVRWMCRRQWLSLWQYNRRKILISNIQTNIAVAKNEQIAMNYWLNEPEDRDKIFGNYTQIGFATLTSKSGYHYWCVYYV